MDMTLAEKAHELGEMIKACPEMAALNAAEAAQEADEKAQELMKEFNLKRMNLARDMHEGKIKQDEAIRKNNEAFQAMVDQSKTIADYVEAKKAFDSRVNEINGILNYYITGQDPNCTHDCSTCGGCH